MTEDFGGLSLQAGFLTSAAENGASIFAMMDVSRHKIIDPELTMSGTVPGFPRKRGHVRPLRLQARI